MTTMAHADGESHVRVLLAGDRAATGVSNGLDA